MNDGNGQQYQYSYYQSNDRNDNRQLNDDNCPQDGQQYQYSYYQSNDRNDNRQLNDGPEDNNKRHYQYSYYQSNDRNNDNNIRQLNDGYIPRDNNDLSSYSYSIDTNPFGTFAILDNTLPTSSPTSKPSEDFIRIKVTCYYYIY